MTVSQIFAEIIYAIDDRRAEREPLRPSGRDHDPDRVQARLAGLRAVRSAMVAGRVEYGPSARP
jgi:hypothetical protein